MKLVAITSWEETESGVFQLAEGGPPARISFSSAHMHGQRSVLLDARKDEAGGIGANSTAVINFNSPLNIGDSDGIVIHIRANSADTVESLKTGNHPTNAFIVVELIDTSNRSANYRGPTNQSVAVGTWDRIFIPFNVFSFVDPEFDYSAIKAFAFTEQGSESVDRNYNIDLIQAAWLDIASGE